MVSKIYGPEVFLEIFDQREAHVSIGAIAPIHHTRN